MIWRMFRSVRFRLTLWHLLALTVVLLVYAGGVFLFLRKSLGDKLDRGLNENFERAEELLTESADGALTRVSTRHRDQEVVGAWVEAWRPGGTLLYRSPELARLVSVGVLPPPGRDRTGYESLTLPDGTRVRTLTGIRKFAGPPVTLRVLRSEEPLRHELRELLLILVLGLPVAITLAGNAGYLVAKRALAPIERMADRARRITAANLHERLAVENPDDELGHLATVCNETFARLERSFEQLKRFTSDASHELRTPLTAIRSVGEVGLREPRDAQAYRAIIGSMLEEADRLARLIDSLLTLSRADAGQVTLHRGPVDLVDLAEDVAQHLGVLAEEKRQTLALSGSSPVTVLADRLVLRQAVINLVDNAIKYSPEGSVIRIAVRTEEDSRILDVTDSGPGITPEERERIFDRFYRVDRTRAREHGDTGLGLAIARWAVTAHGGSIQVSAGPQSGSCFRIVLPAQHAGADGISAAANV
ncbi:MAG: ATP-binding protein [Acidobacteriota bacterium]|nr:MAG: ATP-binding protein [Acidobacteriota bacterium]